MTRLDFQIINSWTDEDTKKYRILHWFGITTVNTPYPYPVREIHIWLFNFDIRLMWWKY